MGRRWTDLDGFELQTHPDLIERLILGYADDAIIVTLVLHSTVRRAGLDAVRARWPGTDDLFQLPT